MTLKFIKENSPFVFCPEKIINLIFYSLLSPLAPEKKLVYLIFLRLEGEIILFFYFLWHFSSKKDINRAKKNTFHLLSHPFVSDFPMRSIC
jgi:hypothetical protein